MIPKITTNTAIYNRKKGTINMILSKRGIQTIEWPKVEAKQDGYGNETWAYDGTDFITFYPAIIESKTDDNKFIVTSTIEYKEIR